MLYSIDRFEEGSAVCSGEDGTVRRVSLSNIPPGLKEGDILRESEGVYSFDREETAARRQQNRELQRKIKWE